MTNPGSNGAPGSPTRRLSARRFARLAADSQGVFLALLALVHHRLSADLSSIPPALHDEFQALAQGVVRRLEAIANRLEGKPESPAPALPPLFARVQGVARDVLPTLDSTLSAHLPGRIALYQDLLARITQLDQDAGWSAGSASGRMAALGASGAGPDAAHGPILA